MFDRPSYSPARFNHAATLVAIGELEEAKRAIPKVEALRSEMDWHGTRIYSTALIAGGHFEEAAEILQRALKDCPWRKQLVKLRTTLGYVQMKLGKVSDSIVSLEQDLALVDDSTRQMRLVLLGQAQSAQGNYSVANALLGRMVKTKDAQLESLRQHFLTLLHRLPRNFGEIPDRLEVQVLLAA
jgi:tetratricopeptide (TPR) repeat protein